MKHKIKIGFLISYDYRFLYTALKMVYGYADEIILAIDINRTTWAGQKFDLANDFFDKVDAIDVGKKITIFEDNFYIPTLSAIENDTRERNMLSEKMAGNCWKLQIDSDEYFLNFKEVYKFLRKHRYFLSKPHLNQVNLRAKWVTLFRKTENGYLYIDNDEHFAFAVNNSGKHVFARDLDWVTNREVYTNYKAVHQSWAREPDEILQKVNNWGHKDDFDTKKFFDFWNTVNEDNYTQFTNIHPIAPEKWPKLEFIACSDAEDFIKKYNELHPTVPKTKVSARLFKKFFRNKIKFWRK